VIFRAYIHTDTLIHTYIHTHTYRCIYIYRCIDISRLTRSKHMLFSSFRQRSSYCGSTDQLVALGDLPDVIRFDAFGRPMNPRGRTGEHTHTHTHIYIYIYIYMYIYLWVYIYTSLHKWIDTKMNMYTTYLMSSVSTHSVGRWTRADGQVRNTIYVSISIYMFSIYIHLNK